MSEAQASLSRSRKCSPLAWLWKSATALVILSVLIYLLLRHQGERVISPWDAVLSCGAFSVLIPFMIIGLFLLPDRSIAQLRKYLLPSTILAFTPIGIGQFYLKASIRSGASENYPAMEAAHSKCWLYFGIGLVLLSLFLLACLFLSVCGWRNYLWNEKPSEGSASSSNV